MLIRNSCTIVVFRNRLAYFSKVLLLLSQIILQSSINFLDYPLDILPS